MSAVPCTTQGDGELSGVAIEQRATVTLQIDVIEPRALHGRGLRQVAFS